MNRTSNLRRKLVYLVVLLAMLIPLYLLGQPAGGQGDLGGRLSEMRHQYNMAESDLGEISPASETMKLASLGMRGVAATLLHEKAHEYKVRHEWDRYKATLNNIALLQPHFDRVWEQQAHNLAYNVAVEFDDYRQRYEMIREGTEYLTRGVRQNKHAPRLIWYTGWFYGEKLGVADEKKQYRRLFSDDEILHQSLMEENIAVDSPEARGPNGKPDNWLVGRLWLFHGYDLVDSGIKIRRQTPLNFFETGPKWRIKHAEAIEREGVLDESAENAWEMAAEDWIRFGNRSIPTTSPFTIKLDQLDELFRQISDRHTQFRELTQKAYDVERQKRIGQFSENDREILEKPFDELTSAEKIVRAKLESSMVPALADIIKRADPAVRLTAVRLSGEIQDLTRRYLKTEGYRDQINYAYWKTVCLAEQEERTVRARRLVYQARQANRQAELDKAIELYEQAFEIWAEIFEDYPILSVDQTAERLFQSIRRYMTLIDTKELPEDFPLKAFVQMMGDGGEVNPQRYQELQHDFEASAQRRKQELAQAEQERESQADDRPGDDDTAESEQSSEAEAGSSQIDSKELEPVESDSESVKDNEDQSDQ